MIVQKNFPQFLCFLFYQLNNRGMPRDTINNCGGEQNDNSFLKKTLKATYIFRPPPSWLFVVHLDTPMKESYFLIRARFLFKLHSLCEKVSVFFVNHPLSREQSISQINQVRISRLLDGLKGYPLAYMVSTCISTVTSQMVVPAPVDITIPQRMYTVGNTQLSDMLGTWGALWSTNQKPITWI